MQQQQRHARRLLEETEGVLPCRWRWRPPPPRVDLTSPVTPQYTRALFSRLAGRRASVRFRELGAG
jgi:hypothetical protein